MGKTIQGSNFHTLFEDITLIARGAKRTSKRRCCTHDCRVKMSMIFQTANSADQTLRKKCKFIYGQHNKHTGKVGKIN